VKELEDSIIHLLSTKPFYGHILMRMDRIVTDSIPTAGVGITDTTLKLAINPEFFKGLSSNNRLSVLEHEVLHVVSHHMLRFKSLEDDKFKVAKNFNVAADIAINQLIKDMPDKLLINGKMTELATYNNIKTKIPKAEPMQTSEYYYKLLCENAEESGDMQPIDSHEGFENMDSEKFKSITDKLIDEAEKSCGSMDGVPQELRKALANRKSEIKWKSILRNIINTADEAIRRPTRKRINRRFGILQPGHTKLRNLNIVVGVDVSGSVETEILRKFLSEVSEMSKSRNSNITLLFCDTSIKQEVKYKEGFEYERGAYGGTNYAPMFNRVLELKPDVFFLFGDGECFDTKDIKKPKCEFAWVLYDNFKRPTTWGKEIKLGKT